MFNTKGVVENATKQHEKRMYAKLQRFLHSYINVNK